MKTRTQGLLQSVGVLLLVIGTAWLPNAHAADTIKIGVLTPLSGTFADMGQKMQEGLRLFMKQNGDMVAGKKIELIYKDTTGIAPDVAKRLAQELVTRDRVQILTGFGLTPNAMAVAPVATQAKVPEIIMNAATAGIPAKSPYIVRFSFTLSQVSAPLGRWAYRNGIQKVYTVVTDYGPGHDAEQAFVEAFKKAGGEIVGSVRVPVRNMEYGPFMQRAADAKPDAIFSFTPTGDTGIAFMKAYSERGLADQGIKLITTGDVIEDQVLETVGDVALGTITTHHYSMAHDSPENKAFLKAYTDMFGANARPSFVDVQTYDAMTALYAVLEKLNGDTDADRIVDALKGYRAMSPRGPIYIDPETRDIVQNVYVRKTEKVNGRLFNVEFETIPNVKPDGSE